MSDTAITSTVVDAGERFQEGAQQFGNAVSKLEALAPEPFDLDVKYKDGGIATYRFIVSYQFRDAELFLTRERACSIHIPISQVRAIFPRRRSRRGP